MTSRELVIATIEFTNHEGWVPRQMWTLPWTQIHYPEILEKIRKDFPNDIVTAPCLLKTPTISKGTSTAVGEYIDEWGCKFLNIHEGVIGEVKEAVVVDTDWKDQIDIHIPTELLSFDVDAVNKFCENTDKFVVCGACPRPFEQLQFLRTTPELFMDLVDPPDELLAFIGRMHGFYCKLLEKWAQTDIDGITFMDDWGSQQSLLINPDIWVEIFKPMYKDYIDIAKKYGKKTFMHSDGNILAIIPHLIEIGLDALNTQIFCIGIEKLKLFQGNITFWGEIDRQHLLPNGTTEEVDAAVKQVYKTLWSNGGCIAQCEFGPGAKPENVYQVFDTWSVVENKII